MGILADFMIKHVRPVGDGWDLVTEDPQLRAALRRLSLTDDEVDRIFAAWSLIQHVKPDTPTNRDLFTSAARTVSRARWDELYETSYSTILFLDAAQIKELSFAGSQHPNTERLSVRIAQPAVVAAVTIHRNSDAAQFADPLPAGVEVATDAQGNVNHFWRLLP